MTDRSARVLRAATFVVFGLVVLLVLRTCYFSTGETDQPETVEKRSGELTILEAQGYPGGESVVVRGYLFYDEKRGMRLFDFRGKGKPPEGKGPYLDVVGVDQGSFNFESGTNQEFDLEVFWLEEPVALVGTIKGREFAVEDILQ